MKTLLLLLLATPLLAVEFPPQGKDLSTGGKIGSHVFAENGTSQKLAEGVEVHVTKVDSSKPYSAQVSLTCPGQQTLPAQSPVLAIIRARSKTANAGAFIAKMQLGAAPYTAFSGSMEVPVTTEWQELPVLFVTQSAIDTDKLQLALLCGTKVQTLEISHIRIQAYAVGTDTAAFPRIRRSYVGREADAAWRKDALARIEKNRKADLSTVIKDATGKVLANTTVTLDLRRHAFGFGSAITVAHLLEQSKDGEQFRKTVDENFSMVVFENDLKDFGWAQDRTEEAKQKRNRDLDQAFAWLAERHIKVRGHYLMQTATPQNLHEKSAQEVRAHYLESQAERMNFVGNRVVEWDVINHPVAWGGADLLTKKPGLEQIDREVFREALKHSKLPMFINEDQIFRPGHQSDGTYEYIKQLKAEGFPVAGLGNQAHFDESFLPSPMDILKTTDRFAEIVPTQVITEFDVTTTEDEALAADFTRDILIASFSHPGYHGFLLWGFWEGRHWKPEAASWNKDWSIRPRGEVFRDWVTVRWDTKITAQTDGSGRIQWRGFPGLYDVQVGDTKLPAIECR